MARKKNPFQEGANKVVMKAWLVVDDEAGGMKIWTDLSERDARASLEYYEALVPCTITYLQSEVIQSKRSQDRNAG